MKKFDIDNEYRLYLERMGLVLDHMPIEQIVETKRAFIGGVSQLFVFLEKESPELDNDEKFEMLEELQESLKLYWKAENNNPKPGKHG